MAIARKPKLDTTFKGAAALLSAGAALVYRELPELSHTYPRSENVRILDWFAGLPAQPSW